MFNKFILVVLALVIAGCKGNPYSGINDRLATNPVQQKPGSVRVGAIDAQSSVEIPEKKPGDAPSEIKIAGHVPSPGSAVITVENAPPWCDVWDASAQSIKCSPPIGAGATSDPAHAYVIFKVLISLSSSAAPVAKVTQEMSIIVRHEATGAVIDFPDNKLQIAENSMFQGVISVGSADFPKGPFTISAINLPVGVTIGATHDPTKFYVKYAPGFGTVGANNYDRNCYDRNSVRHMCLSMSWVLNIVDPRGAIQTANADWVVMDIRQNPKVTVPSNLTSYSVTNNGATTLTADFEVPFEDLNNEVAPKVTIPTQPSVGSAAVSVAATGNSSPNSNPYTFAHVLWTGVPATAKGTTQTLSLQSCVWDYLQYYKQCSTTPINVQF